MTVEVITRLPVLVGGPNAGERLPEYAWEQPESERQVVAFLHDGQPFDAEAHGLPVGVTVEVTTYVARKLRLAGVLLEGFIYDELAYGPEGIAAVQRALVQAATAHWRGE